jgi:zinc-binding alcohol dehydrogenase family protein
MKAIGFSKNLPIEDADSLFAFDLPEPKATGRDLLVEVKAISVNPVDYKIRVRRPSEAGQRQILGWDATGIVRAVGENVTLFKPGDRVWYAGDLTRHGSNAELQLVDERIVGNMPESIGFADAAALPLTSITAWELLFDRLEIRPGKRPEGQRLLIVGAAGGVGSILTQIARRLTGATVIGTASRPETQAWVQAQGAHHVIDHSKSFVDELKRIGLPNVTHIASLNQTATHFDQYVEIIAPQGRIGLIDDPETPLDFYKLKPKSVSLHWELMFTRSLFQTGDMIAQHQLLDEVASLVDAGVIRPTVGEHFGTINVNNLKRAHKLLETGKTRGKIVLEGF